MSLEQLGQDPNQDYEAPIDSAYANMSEYPGTETKGVTLWPRTFVEKTL